MSWSSKGFNAGIDPVEACANQDPNAPDHRDMMRQCEHADAAIIREQGNLLLHG